MKWFLPLLLITFCFSCSHPKPELSFYYWKSSPQQENDTFDKATIKALGIRHFYIHYMDIDWSTSLNMPVPRAWIDSYDDKASFVGVPFSPVIYITNTTFLRMDSVLCDTLAVKLAKAINRTTTNLLKAYDHVQVQNGALDNAGLYFSTDSTKVAKRTSEMVKEIQIDCDWTSKTRDKYFYFLKMFKRQFPDKVISATIRLYPYKYPQKMGVPPVDKGMLMCYNLGNIKDLPTSNSILDVTQLKLYLDAKEYPLPLDVSLPVFGWYAWFSNNHFKGIIYKNETENMDRFLKIEKGNLYRAKEDFEVQNKYIREGDILRSEFPEEQQLMDASNLLKEHVDNIQRIAFYHWDKNLLKKYEPTIQKIYRQF